jgi:ankyrin repeat protein
MVLKAFKEKRLFGETGLDWQWQLKELESLFFRVVIEAAKVREVDMFVDALDEAVEKTGDKAAGTLVEFFHQLNDRVTYEGGSARICISCRKYPVVASVPGLEIRVEDENEVDIRTFVHRQLTTGVAIWNQDPSMVKACAALEAAIVKKAAGVFQWAAIRVPRLTRRLNDGRPISEIYELLDAESNELVVLYQNIIQNEINACDRRESLHLMQWICHAERPLSVTELRLALACDDEHVRPAQMYCEESKRFVESDSRMQKLTVSLSGGLAEVKFHETGSTVQFVHQSVKDFLLSGGLAFLVSAPAEPSSLAVKNIVGLSEDRLSKSCINYLKLGDILREDRSWDTSIETELPFISYATKCLFLHAERAERCGITQEDLVQQFKYPPQTLRTWVNIYRVIDGGSVKCPWRGSSLIHYAARSNLQSTTRSLLKQGISIQCEDKFGFTALHFAAESGHEDLVSMLLDFNANIDAKTDEQATPLQLAAANGYDAVVQLLIKRGAGINEKTGESGTALQSAAEKGKFGLVRTLIENGADVNAQGGHNGNALQAAAGSGHAEVVKLLIAKGADVNANGGYYGTALQAAAGSYDHRSHVIVELLLKMGAHVNANGGYYGTALQAAAHRKSELLVDLLLKMGAHVNAQGRFGSALQAASRSAKTAQLLLDRNAEVNLGGGEYGNALQAAAFHNNFKLVEMLLERGARINEQGGLYGCALQAAAAAGSEEIFHLLLKKGAVINIQGGRFGNVLQAAAYSGSKAIVQELLRRGVNLHTRGGEYGTALQAAAFDGHKAVVQMLLDKGADLNVQEGMHGSALDVAMSKASDEFVEFLLAQGADVNARGSIFQSPLHRAIVRDRLGCVQLLLKRGAEVNANVGGPYFVSALLLAASGYEIEIVRTLLDEGAEINMQCGQHGNALQAAARYGHSTIVKLLLDRGADVNAEGRAFGSALEAAGGRSDITKILLDAGARQVNDAVG